MYEGCANKLSGNHMDNRRCLKWAFLAPSQESWLGCLELLMFQTIVHGQVPLTPFKCGWNYCINSAAFTPLSCLKMDFVSSSKEPWSQSIPKRRVAPCARVGRWHHVLMFPPINPPKLSHLAVSHDISPPFKASNNVVEPQWPIKMKLHHTSAWRTT